MNTKVNVPSDIPQETYIWENQQVKKQMLKKRKNSPTRLNVCFTWRKHKYCLPHSTEKCVINVATVKPSLFLQLKQTESVISWLLLPNPKSQEDYMWFESSSLYLFFTGLFQLFQTISVFTCTKPLQSNRKHLALSRHAAFGLLKEASCCACNSSTKSHTSDFQIFIVFLS